ncbi:PHP domain-containing protein [Methanococcus voltae]|uniref:Metal-dependent phosphoesterase TrpH n=2 Tax=Methanococcus voltae TaxID=2188 RepID=A0ABT2EVP9_METVO|nr:PHP domain-containing protein [Methanococcus voltae]MBP2172262.1 putative metal-dependent phosphoesterase TrpH [Methanococcus voltae]MBP2200782.1 putative metal-dependent phosphoesterase TrpH [Methanococcus voltae]MCS3921506.1 putative metal-dependent phosphoesterase TrpH [Methanococcus voltae PS]
MEDYNSLADLHTHSKYSGLMRYMGLKFPDSVEEPEKIVRCAAKRGLNVVAVTDHNTIQGGLKATEFAKKYNVDVVVGSEVMTNDGEILGLYLNEEIPKFLSAEETIDLIHEQGGLAVCPHPYSPICHAVGDKIFDLDLDGVEVYNAYHRDGIVNNIALDKVLKNYHKKSFAFLGNSDAHIARMVGNGHTKFNGETAEDLYTSIKSRKTSFHGTPTPLSDIILWSYNIVYASEKALFNSAFRKKEDNILKYQTTRFKKCLGAFCGMAYIGTPLPLLAGVAGNMYLKRKAKAKYRETYRI